MIRHLAERSSCLQVVELDLNSKRNVQMRVKYTELRICCPQGIHVTHCAYNDAEEYITFISQTTNIGQRSGPLSSAPQPMTHDVLHE